jgi:predicted nucleic acid-binding protein
MDKEEEKDSEAIVLDTNIILASVLKRGSYTRQVVIYLTDILGIKAFTPEKALQEIDEHLEELAKRKKISVEELRAAIRILLLNVNIVSKETYNAYMKKAEECVKDLADTDFAALALHLSENYEKVILLTWNKNDYNENCLKTHGVILYTPSDLRAYVN